GFPTCPEASPTPGQVAMLVWLEQFLVRYPELALFLVIAVGYWIGRLQGGGGQPWPGDRLSVRRPVRRTVCACARLGHDQVLSVLAVPVWHRLLGRPAVYAGAKARWAEADAAGR